MFPWALESAPSHIRGGGHSRTATETSRLVATVPAYAPACVEFPRSIGDYGSRIYWGLETSTLVF
jgi:hypothetical protein